MTELEAVQAEMRTMVEDARNNFHRVVGEILHDAQRLADSLATAIGDVSPAQALDAWKCEIAKRLQYTTEGKGE